MRPQESVNSVATEMCLFLDVVYYRSCGLVSLLDDVYMTYDVMIFMFRWLTPLNDALKLECVKRQRQSTRLSTSS